MEWDGGIMDIMNKFVVLELQVESIVREQPIRVESTQLCSLFRKEGFVPNSTNIHSITKKTIEIN